MSLPKKSIAVLLTVVLVSSFFGGFAFAEESGSALNDKSELADQAQDIATNEGQEGATDEETVEDPVNVETAEVLEPTEETQDATESRGTIVDDILAAGYEYKEAVDVVEYVYLDSTLIPLNEEENIVVGLLEGSSNIDSASLVIEKINNGDQTLFESTNIMEIDALFTFALTEKEEATAYQVVGIQLDLVDGSKLYADFTTDTVEENTYFFDVITEELAETLNAEKEDEDISVYVIEDDGSLKATETVEEAIQIVDGEKANTLESAESVIDQEALDQGLGTLENEEDEEDEEDEAPSSIFGSAIAWLQESFGPKQAYAAVAPSREGYVLVAIDAGHGGEDPGAIGEKDGKKVYEKNVNLEIAKYCRDELLTYSGISPRMIRDTDRTIPWQDRAGMAVSMGADILVSIHCNSSTDSTAHGAEVIVPNKDTKYNQEAAIHGDYTGQNILNRISALGIDKRRVYSTEGEKPYPDGSKSDGFAVINGARKANIPGLIVEHGFISNATEVSKLTDPAFQKKLGQADAAGIAESYAVIKDSVARSTSTIKTTAHISNVGWLTGVYDQKIAGTEGKSFGLEAFQLNLQNGAASQGGITYRSYVGGAWQSWESNGGTSGTTGKSTPLEAIQIKLTGNAANMYDVYYRVHVANIGWLGWAKNGASAGSIGYKNQAEAIHVTLVEKNGAAPGSSSKPPFAEKNGTSTTPPTVNYQAHVSNVGWQAAVSEGKTAGTMKQSRAIEALKVTLKNAPVSGTISYSTHVSGIGWQNSVTSGAMAGTTGQSRQLEAIKISLTGDLSRKYDVYYRVHCQDYGWLDWAKNGQVAGTAGYGKRMEAIEIKIVANGGKAPGATTSPSRIATLTYTAHVSNVGWQGAVFNGGMAGTTGQTRSVEALTISLLNQSYSGGITYQAHVSNIGWQDWRSNGVMSGTTGQSRKMEAIRIKLTGEMANKYDIYYRAHSQNFGWLGWAKNGADAGTSGYGYQMEAIEIRLVTKNAGAPGTESRPYVKANQIMGGSQTTVAQMVKRWNAMGKTFPKSTYEKYGASNITQFCTILLEEANAEGVRAEVVFAQAMHETGWLQFGNDVKANQCNFAGIGATGGVPGEDFVAKAKREGYGEANAVRIGLRAQVQHLKAYASTAKLVNPCVDPRFHLVSRGCAPTVDDLGGRWATGSGYGTALNNQIKWLLAS